MPLLSEFVDSYRDLLEKKLQDLIPEKPSSPYHSLYQAARYSLFSKGKRLRPLLSIASAISYGAEIDAIIQPACTLELIHTYSLIHDDLPCMDNDDLRRGKPTLHKVYSEGHAVLTGDFLLTYAFQLLSESPYLTSQQKIELIQTLSLFAGGEGMVGGQVIDIAFQGEKVEWDTLCQIHLGKTASLFIASLLFGAIVADVENEDKNLLKRAGTHLGLAYQIFDDLLDYAQKDKEFGKNTNIVFLMGVEKAKLHMEKNRQKAVEIFGMVSKPSSLLIELVESFLV
ncbi:MAG: polyprenyl synthetase family protein [Chlamydiae bacterium]|nr:polyprenyl synthetase family protein [Chlamydiota bacterium]